MSDNDPKPAPCNNQHVCISKRSSRGSFQKRKHITSPLLNKWYSSSSGAVCPRTGATTSSSSMPPNDISSRFCPKNSYWDASKSLLFESADTKHSQFQQTMPQTHGLKALRLSIKGITTTKAKLKKKKKERSFLVFKKVWSFMKLENKKNNYTKKKKSDPIQT